ncbi:MAG TPA: alpha/beta fold hydrolase [Candidatus Saccharimonadales bacterium]|nr:alpha/beta fold hydrolase [Candidatus Saccharimonadales bacterium]
MDKFPVATYAKGDPEAEKLALFLPGLLDSKDYPHMHDHVDFSARLGYYAMAPDMPGTWESGNDITDFTTTNCLAAIKTIVSTVNKPAFVFGHSNGGRLAALAAAENPQIEAIGIAMSAATTYTPEQTEAWRIRGAKTSNRDLPDNPEQSRQFDLPFAFCKDARNYDAVEALRTLKIPKLFVYGELDTLVRSSEVKQTFNSSADPKRILSLNVEHDYRFYPQAILRMNDMLGRFLALYCLLPK